MISRLEFGDPAGFGVVVVYDKKAPYKFRILAGCRDFTVAQAKKHWQKRSIFGAASRTDNRAADRIRSRARVMLALIPAMQEAVARERKYKNWGARN